MTTPIYDFIVTNSAADFSRLHMPGHKGQLPFWTDFNPQFDITEITNADQLFESNGIISQSEENTAILYGAKHTSFSAGGSTLCIQAMLALACGEGTEVIAARNVHSSFVNSCALLNLTPHFVLPVPNDSFFVSGEIAPDRIEAAIKAYPLSKAVYITSPDYLGCMSDVAAIACLCKRYNLPLIVDNAHGAHLKHTKKDCHPMTLGATMCCDSAHKTLPVLTGGAYLHVNKHSNLTKEEVKSAMQLFGSTSPSYLILTSLDLNNHYLESNANADFIALESNVQKLETLAFSKGLTPISPTHDITKLTLDAYQIGYSGNQLFKHFQSFGIEAEYAAMRHVVLMLSPFNSSQDLTRLFDAIDKLIKAEPIFEIPQDFLLPKSICSVREAVFSKKAEISIDDAVGRIAAQTKIKCPPGVPIVIPGEIIDVKTQKLLKKSSIFSLSVVE